jgi:hypothetical protein
MDHRHHQTCCGCYWREFSEVDLKVRHWIQVVRKLYETDLGPHSRIVLEKQLLTVDVRKN